jgi:hypothetical protein
MEINQQKLDEFQARMNNWISAQGLLFQLTHSGRVSGAPSVFLLWFGRMVMRLSMVLGLGVVIFWGYLVKRVDFVSFQDELNVRVAEALHADSTAGGIERSGGHLEINKMELVGSDEAFFDQAEIRGLRTKMGLLDGILTEWDGETISIEKLDITIKAGSEDDEAGSKIFQRLFEQSSEFKFSRMELGEATIRWGYSRATWGQIQGSNIRVARSGAGWNLIVTGGQFSQNWMRNFEIERMKIDILPEGVEIREAKFKRGSGTMNFTASLAGPASNPTVKGTGTMHAIPIDQYLISQSTDGTRKFEDGFRLEEFLEGELSGSFVLGGSLYSSSGLTVDAEISLEADDEIVLHKRPNLFTAISVVDRERSYRSIRFRSGGFKFSTRKKYAKFTDISLEAKNLMRLEGQFKARAPTDKEIEDNLRIERTGEEEEPEEPEEEEPEVSADEVEPKAFNLSEAAKAEAADEASDVDRRIKSIWKNEFFGNSPKDDVLESQRQVPVLEGELRLGLLAASLEREAELSKMYPVDKGGVWRWLDVPLDGSIYDAGVEMADEILLRSRASR